MANPVTQTALGPLATVAMEQTFPPDQRLINDSLAYRFLPFAGRLAVTFTRVPPARALFIRLSEHDSPGIWGSVLWRKRYIDDKVADTVTAGVTTVVNLGAGWDTRAYRLPALRTIPVFEVDLPETIAAKRVKLQQIFGRVPANVTLVPIDFDRQDPEEVLRSSGYRPDEKTLFIWVAVTPYLTESGVRQTFSFLANATAGSQLAFTYVQQDFLDGTSLFGLSDRSQLIRLSKQLWRFGLKPDHVAAFLADYGWRDVEQMGQPEASLWYPMLNERGLTASDIERTVYAEKLAPKD